MLSFSFLKNKKILALIFLGIFVCSGLFYFSQTALGAGRQITAGEIFKIPSAENGSLNELGKFDFADQLVVGIGQGVINGSFKLAALSGVVLSYIMTTIMTKAITTDPNFTPAWSQVINLANMLIVLGFVIVGIATALRFKDYEAKKLLFPLIIVALLVNFSGLFCGLIIDASNLVMNGLGIGSSGGSMPGTVLDKIWTSSASELNITLELDHPTQFMAECFLFGFMYLGIAFTFLYLSILLIARYAILIILYILSPLAFVFYAFPSAKKLWSEWWSNFLQWCFVGVFGSFVLWVSSSLLTETTASKDIATMFTTCVVFLIFIYVGFKMTAKNNGLAAKAGGAIMGAADAGAGLGVELAAGVAKGGVKMADKATGGRGSAAIQNLKSGYGRAMERVGLRQTGSTAAANSKQVEDQAGLMAKEYTAAKATGDKSSMARIQTLARTGKGAQGAAAMKVIADAGEIEGTFKNGKGEFDASGAAQRLSYAETFGSTGIRDNAEKATPGLAKYNTRKVNDEIQKAQGTTRQLPGGGTITGMSQAEAEENVTKKAFERANVGDIRKFSNETLGRPEFIEHTSANKVGKAAQEMSTSQVDTIKKHIPYIKDQMKAAHTAGNRERYNELKKKLAETATL